MRKNRILILGTLALVLTFGAAQQASAQLNAFSSAANRDAQMLELLESMPYYIISVGGDTLQQAVGTFYPLNAAINDIHYTVISGALWIFFEAIVGKDARGNNDYETRCVIFEARDTKAKVEAAKRSNERDETVEKVFGPFEAGSTDASRKAALQRILAAVKAYEANGNKVPEQW